MAARYVLGIDVGTTALKAIALERDRGIVAQVEHPHELISLHPGWAWESALRGITPEEVQQDYLLFSVIGVC